MGHAIVVGVFAAFTGDCPVELSALWRSHNLNKKLSAAVFFSQFSP